MPNPIEHEENDRGGSFFIEEDGKRVAEMTYRRKDPRLVVIDHTEVDPAMEGGGVGRSLLDSVVSWARATGTKVGATCSFARAQFEKDPSIQDVLERKS